MIPFANERELPGDDVRVISEYLSRIQLPTKLPPIDEENFDALERLEASKRVVNIKDYPGDIVLGKKVYLKECASCHVGNHSPECELGPHSRQARANP